MIITFILVFFVTLLKYQKNSPEMIQRRVITSLMYVYPSVNSYVLRAFYEMNRKRMFEDLWDG